MSLHKETLTALEAGPIGGQGGESIYDFAKRVAEIEQAACERENSTAAMKAHGASFDDLHICGNCDSTGYIV